MNSSSERYRWLKVALTATSILAGLPWGVLGCLVLPLVIRKLVIHDYSGGHLGEFLIMGLVTVTVGGGTVAAGIYTLAVTKGYKRWGELSIRDKIIAYMAMLGIVWNIGFWQYALSPAFWR